VTSATAVRSVLGDSQRWVTGIVVASTALAVGVAGWFGLSWYQAAHDGSLAAGTARDTVLQDAQQATINLNTLDYRRVQDGLALWEQSATGSLLDEVRANRATYAQVITESRTATTAGALDGAVAELDERAGTARVLVGVDVTTVHDGGQASCVRRRIQLEMRRSSGAGVPQNPGAGAPLGAGTVWKVDKLAPVGAANPVPGACPSVKSSPPPPGPPPPGPPPIGPPR
jgi:Mce-associated membrane protein